MDSKQNAVTEWHW